MRTAVALTVGMMLGVAAGVGVGVGVGVGAGTGTGGGGSAGAAAGVGTTLATGEAVRAVKRGIVEGHCTKNRVALDALYATDYTALDARGGLRRKADLLAGLATDLDMVEGRYDLRAVRRWGSVVVASGHGRMVYRNADGSTRVSEYDSVNVFEQRAGKWW